MLCLTPLRRYTERVWEEAPVEEERGPSAQHVGETPPPPAEHAGEDSSTQQPHKRHTACDSECVNKEVVVSCGEL